MTLPSASSPAGSPAGPPAGSPAGSPSADSPAAERPHWSSGSIARAAIVVLAVWFGLQLLWSVSSLVFLVFLATLFGLAVGRGVDYLERFRIRRGIGSALIVFGTLGVIGGGLALSAPTLIEQGRQLQTEFPAAVVKLQEWVDSKQRTGAIGALIKAATRPPESDGGGSMRAPSAISGSVAAPAVPAPTVPAPTFPAPTFPAPAVPAPTVLAPALPALNPAGPAAPSATQNPPVARPGALPSDALKQRLSGTLSKASGYLFSFVSSTLAVLTAVVLLIFLAIYIGAEPEVYRGWMLAAVPAPSRAHVRRVLAEVATVLRKWLVTQLVAMIVIGGVCTIVLLVLGVKAPFALGFIAGLMEFIPTVGPVLSAVPAILMGFIDSPEKALAVLIAYWGIQFLENNLLIPFLMRGEMDLPPALTLIAQSLMTLTFGFIGLMVAVPLTAAVLVPIRMIAERENAREKEMVRAKRRDAGVSGTPRSVRVTAEYEIGAAGRGPQHGDLSEGDS